MLSPFNLRFITSVQPLALNGDLKELVPYEAPAYQPVDDNGGMPGVLALQLDTMERGRCAEMDKLSARFDCEVIQFVVGFMQTDYQQVSVSDVVRRHRVREAVFALIRSVEKHYEADRI